MADTMIGLKRTHYCERVSAADEGVEVVVSGWVQRARDLGNLIFIDLRDRSGIVQLAFNDETAKEIFEKAASARSEFVLMAKGTVKKRQSANTEILNGDIEIFVTDLRVLAKSETTPFEITDTTKVNEELRLKYRYLDLRRSEMQNTIILRHKIVKVARDYYDQNNFLEIETPVLIKATPEGARDYLVPSRVHEGKFYALPQSPQLYKQLLMLSGFDRYMQIARCFRDEDLRSDRQPEFTQIDIEMSFIDEDDVMSVNEGFMVKVFDEILGVKLQAPFKRLCYDEAMERYGIDKPDTRFGLELVNVSDILKDSTFAVFADAIKAGGSVRGINVKGAAAELSRKEIDKLGEFVKTYKAKGLAFTRFTDDGISSSFEKQISESEIAAIHQRMGAQKGDVLLFVADIKNTVVFDSLGALRNNLAKKLKLYEDGTFDLLWVTDFPLFEYDEDEGRYAAKHHPFTSPKLEEIDKIESDPANAKARAYDLVMNGVEIGGGSIRINDPQIQSRMFTALGFSKEDAYNRFGFLLDAFKYGVPPHGGMAYGLDRLVMLMLGKDSIRDVIAFPKVQNASEPMTNCPDTVDERSLHDLHIKVDI